MPYQSCLRHLASVVLLVPAFALAADGASPDFGSSLLRLVVGFALVIGLLFGLLWVLKKVSVPRGGAGNLVRVVSAAAVGPRERVVLVDVAGKRLVLGVAPGHVGLLDTQDAPNDTLTAPDAATTPAPAFAQWLQKTLARRHEK